MAGYGTRTVGEELRPARALARAGVEGDGAGRAHVNAEEKPAEDFGVSLTTRPTNRCKNRSLVQLVRLELVSNFSL